MVRKVFNPSFPNHFQLKFIMQPIPENIIKFLRANHVISIAAAADGEIWSACCFYVPDEAQARLIVLTSAQYRQNQRHTADSQRATADRRNREKISACPLLQSPSACPRDEKRCLVVAFGKYKIYGQQTGFRSKNPLAARSLKRLNH